MENIATYDTEIVAVENPSDVPEPTKVQEKLNKIKMYQQVVQKQLIPGIDYGQSGENQKPTLLKPGAEKIIRIHGLVDKYEIIEKIENWEKGFFYYFIKCILIHYDTGKVVAEGIGSCNSKESKYRWRWVTEKDLPPGVDKNALTKKTMQGQYGHYTLYKTENDEIFSLVNTIQKIAKKRALIDATLSACRLSSVFTQDIDDEDIAETNGIKKTPTMQTTTTQSPKTVTPPQTFKPHVTQVQTPKPAQGQTLTQPTQTTVQSVAPTGKELLNLKKKMLELGYSEKEVLEVLKSIKSKEQLDQIFANLESKTQATEEIPEAEIPEEETTIEPF